MPNENEMVRKQGEAQMLQAKAAMLSARAKRVMKAKEFRSGGRFVDEQINEWLKEEQPIKKIAALQYAISPLDNQSRVLVLYQEVTYPEGFDTLIHEVEELDVEMEAAFKEMNPT